MIKYIESAKELKEDQLHGFHVGWPNPPSAQTLLKMLIQSNFIVLAIDELDGNVVGIIKAISDHILSAYIPMLEVRPDYQKQGIGRKLLTQLLKRLEHLYMIDLLCDDDMQSFYEVSGLKRGCGMMRRNYISQSGSVRDDLET